MSAPFRLDGDELLLRVKVLPNAGRNQLAGLRGEELLVRLQAQPRKGEANRELLRFLAKSLAGAARKHPDRDRGELRSQTAAAAGRHERTP